MGSMINPSLGSSLQLQFWEGSEEALDEEYGENSVVFPSMSAKFEQAATFGLGELGGDDPAGSMQLSIKPGAKSVCFADKCIGPLGAAVVGYLLGKGSLTTALAMGVGYWLLSGPKTGATPVSTAPALPAPLPGQGASAQ